LPDGGLLVVASGVPLLTCDFTAFADAGPPPPGNTRAAALHPGGDLYLFVNGSAQREVMRLKAQPGATWSPLGSSPLAQPGGVAAYAPDRRFYVVGGSPSTTVQAFSPGADWAAVAPTAEGHTRGALLTGEDGRLYAFFGASDVQDGGYEWGDTNRIEAYGPTVDVSPTTGPAGMTNVRVTGDNFAADAVVQLYWGTRETGTLLRTTTTSATGTFTNIAVTIPQSAATGAGRITAVDARARYPAFIPFTVQ
jgi:hypothetical protein